MAANSKSVRSGEWNDGEAWLGLPLAVGSAGREKADRYCESYQDRAFSKPFGSVDEQRVKRSREGQRR